MCSARRRSRSSTTASASSPRATTSASPTRPAQPFEPIACDVFITEATFGLPVFRHPPDREEIGRLLKSVAQFPERVASRRRLCARQGAARHPAAARLPATTSRSTSTARWRSSATITRARASTSASSSRRPSRAASKGDFAGAIVVGPPSAFADRWARRFPDPVACLRLRLDAHPPARQAARRRTAADHLRPFRLGRADRHDRARPARPRSGSRMAARRRWCAGANSTASRRGRCISSATRTRAIDETGSGSIALSRAPLCPVGQRGQRGTRLSPRSMAP